MATLRERQLYRERVLTALYEATEGNRLLGVPVVLPGAGRPRRAAGGFLR
ncbi:hypothetical protein [Streptomyces gardneri]|uniref:Uncharacterized protein n=1 Tax=Streptomyces gardneri TaxID=66892 RepID=A0A4Y3RPS9_9ACTN|nr:hypothetical protein [Streptomyces gardneri]GEB58787.1 hypothetical protein SGA01_43920 [Streptomyces gardneri]GHH07453.1 hypothetical protein GCM10017674_48930 [Streptomyces gardneri]